MSSNTINPKPCNYGCSTRIYWNTLENAYFEVFSKKKHVFPKRSKSSVVPSTNVYKSIYYNNNKKSFVIQQPKPKMSNSFELFTGPIAD
ncbi:MAG TPA: hypothetical protein VFZ46_04420, partial [Nitrososphaeraceae archaeon]